MYFIVKFVASCKNEDDAKLSYEVEPKYRCTLCCVTAEIDPIYQQITVNHFIVKFVIYNATPTAL